jgi:hypothetical protein
VIKRWWTSWRLLKSGSSRPNEWRYGAGAEAHGGGNGVISFFLSFIFHLSRGTKGSGGELRHLAGSPGGGGDIRSCHTLVRVNTVWINNNKRANGLQLFL